MRDKFLLSKNMYLTVHFSAFDDKDIANSAGGNMPCITCSGGRRHCSASGRGFTQRIY